MIMYNNESWLTVKEVSKLYNFSLPSIYRKMKKEKKWRYLKVDGKYHINSTDLNNKIIQTIYCYKCGDE
jgi:hypothetical protein